MQSSSLLSLPDALVSQVAASSSSAQPTIADGALAFFNLRTALFNYAENPAGTETWTELLTASRLASAMMARLPRKETESALATDARALVREVSASGMHDRPVDAADLATAKQLASKGWQGLLAAMLLTPAWQWAGAPSLLSVPDFLRGDFVAWLFAAPQGFSAVGDAETYANYTLQRLEELVRWFNRAPGAEAEAQVLGAYSSQSSVIPLYFSTGNLRRHAELRGRLLQFAWRQPGDLFDATPTPRAGRRLRVGFVNRHFGPQTETYCTVPNFEQLDPERFEVILFAHQSGDSPLEVHCKKNSSDFFQLPEDFDGQLAMLRAAALDIVVFGTNVTAVFNEVTRLALHRSAPLQVINVCSCITSGLAEADLYVSGTLTEAVDSAANFSERLALMPGPAHSFNYSADQQAPQVPCSREEFGLPADAVVFVSGSNYFKIIPEMREAWARLLAAVPESRLLLHPFNPNWSSSYPIKRFRADFDAVLARHQVDPARLVISTKRFPSRTDVKTLLSLGDVYLDTFPFSGVTSVADPLELGLPVVLWEGDTFRSRMGSALLRQLEMPELVATCAADYEAIAVKFATDSGHRQMYRERILARMESAPIFLDSLASSEAFGDVIEAAYDELATVGREAFRANPKPLYAPGFLSTAPQNPSPNSTAEARAALQRKPNDPFARHVIGRALLDAGRTGRATTYLLAALQGEEANGGLWLDVARALRADGQLSEALQALEAGLRLDQTRLEGWVMFAQVANQLGSAEIAREAAGVVRQLDPLDTRVSAYL